MFGLVQDADSREQQPFACHDDAQHDDQCCASRLMQVIPRTEKNFLMKLLFISPSDSTLTLRCHYYISVL